MNLFCKLFGHKYIELHNIFFPTTLICQRCGKAIKYNSQLQGTTAKQVIVDDIMKSTMKVEVPDGKANNL